MIEILLTVVIVMLVIVLSFLIYTFVKLNKLGKNNAPETKQNEIIKLITELSNSISQPLNSNIDELKRSMNESIISINNEVNNIKKECSDTKEKLLQSTNDIQVKLLKESGDNYSKTITLLSNNNKDSIESIRNSLNEISSKMNESIQVLEKTLKENLLDIRNDNKVGIDSIQNLVSNKLEDSLNKKLQESFGKVLEQINGVNQTIGEIRGLASDVGSLKNVLTNVKTKGIMGEVILGNLISEILTKSQYDENVITKKGSKERVEFAIKMPGNEDGEFIYLPVDSKFPTVNYQRILDGIDKGDKDLIDEARKQLKQEIKKFAKDISTKYIDVPNTTSFAIMFLPIEGLYAEVINLGLFDELQRDYNVNIAGPSTFAALLNALQMGFKSLVIQKKSADVFKLLSSIKKEFSRFSSVLERAMQKVDDAGKELSDLVGVRTREIRKQLDKLEDYDQLESSDIDKK